MRHARFDTTLGAHRVEARGEIALVAGDNFRAAVSDNGSRHTRFRAPADLHADSRTPDQPFAPLANERAGEGRAVANVNAHVFQCGRSTVNENQIRRVENARSARADAVSDRRGEERVLYRESAGAQKFEASQPIKAAINHHIAPPGGKRAVSCACDADAFEPRSRRVSRGM